MVQIKANLSCKEDREKPKMPKDSGSIPSGMTQKPMVKSLVKQLVLRCSTALPRFLSLSTLTALLMPSTKNSLASTTSTLAPTSAPPQLLFILLHRLSQRQSSSQSPSTTNQSKRQSRSLMKSTRTWSSEKATPSMPRQLSDRQLKLTLVR